MCNTGGTVRHACHRFWCFTFTSAAYAAAMNAKKNMQLYPRKAPAQPDRQNSAQQSLLRSTCITRPVEPECWNQA